MSSLLHPKGPEPEAVYWRRRLAFVVVLVVVVGLISRVVTGFFSTSAQIASVPSQLPSALTSLTPTDFPVALPSSDDPTPSPTESDGDEGIRDCSDSEIVVQVKLDRKTTKVGAGIQVKLIIKNSSATACVQDIGSGANEVFIKTGDTKVWSSDYCNSSTAKNLVTLKPGVEQIFEVTWNGKMTRKNCEIGKLASAGTYRTFGRNNSTVSDPARFTIE